LFPFVGALILIPMRSMTGFGRGTATANDWEITVHLTSVNRKSLEVALSLPREWQVFEAELGAMVRRQAARGRIQVAVEVSGARVAGMNWDEQTVDLLLDRLAALAERRGVSFSATPELLLQVAQLSRRDSLALEPDRALDLIREALEKALVDFVATRDREGGVLAADIIERTRILSGHADAIAAQSSVTVRNYRELLLQRLRQAGLELDLDDERVLKEIALFADRVDISEEITRVRSHLEHLTELCADPEPVGRKAEFVLQEISREVHTIGSKANDLEIARRVIACKNEIERVREQIQNVE